MNYKRLWIALIVVIVASFSVLGYFGMEIYRQAPPIPGRVVSASGQTLYTATDIHEGQNVWQSMGGQESGSIWGHGAYVAPDWSADWLHREAAALLDLWAKRQYNTEFASLTAEQQGGLQAKLKAELRTNSYDAASATLTVSDDRAAAMKQVAAHYAGVFGHDPAFAKLRDAYAVPPDAIKTTERMGQMAGFFFWTSWACATNRPGTTITYTNNWPAEPLIGNVPTSATVLWSVLSVVFLLAGVGILAWYHAVQKGHEEPAEPAPDHDPLLALRPTPSMKATLKYFYTVAALILAQIGLGAFTAHYGVEGQTFFGFPIAKYLPYAVTRTWHTQIGIFWIATAWLATGLFVAPAISGHEPKFQKLGVNVLFGALLVIVVGSLAGQWFGVQQRLGNVANFWFGHQGYEYVDLGRFWQIFLFAGLFIWLGLMVAAIKPAFKNPLENRHLLALFVVSCAAIGAFYGAGLMWGRHTHLAIAEYWRWWVVHLWVEGFFEVFATVVIAFLFTRMGLLRAKTAAASTLFASTIFLGGGIIGTMHHLYFSGTPMGVLALGATFSALEIVPLTLIGFEAYENLKLSKAQKWVGAYRWPILFFVAVAFWNLVGAGLFGFLINPPIALYYVQGLNTTPVHGHTALFGVYGMLGIGLMLFCLKGFTLHQSWNTKPLKIAFWCLNGGLAAMVLLSLLPIGIIQAIASIDHGLWYARSADLMQQPYMQTLRWMRMFGDILFSVGVASLVYFIFGLRFGWSIQGQRKAVEGRKGRHAAAHGG